MTSVQTVPLGEIATVERSSVQPADIRPGTLYVGLEDIESGGSILGARAVDPGDLASTKFSFTESHVLYGKLRPYLAKIAAPDFAGICSTDIVPVLPGPLLDRRYLLHFLRQPSMVAFASARSVGINLHGSARQSLRPFPYRCLHCQSSAASPPFSIGRMRCGPNRERRQPILKTFGSLSS
jgi:type I restriction enzyme S subunit